MIVPTLILWSGKHFAQAQTWVPDVERKILRRNWSSLLIEARSLGDCVPLLRSSALIFHLCRRLTATAANPKASLLRPYVMAKVLTLLEGASDGLSLMVSSSIIRLHSILTPPPERRRERFDSQGSDGMYQTNLGFIGPFFSWGNAYLSSAKIACARMR